MCLEEIESASAIVFQIHPVPQNCTLRSAVIMEMNVFPGLFIGQELGVLEANFRVRTLLSGLGLQPRQLSLCSATCGHNEKVLSVGWEGPPSE